MPQHNFFAMGQWNACCDVCGRVFKSDKLKPRWDNAMTCAQCWEPRHPQDFVRGVPDNMAVPWSRPWTPGIPSGTVTGSGALGEPYLGESALGA